MVAAVLNGEDDRLVVVVGPCSIHDLDAAREYAEKLRPLAFAHEEELIVVMRTYLEKPRTSVGWKGLITDPELKGVEDIGRGVAVGRRILLDVNEARLPVAVEFLDPMVVPYIQDLVTYGSIGARTVESPVHRSLAAGLSMPMGFKNGRSGDIQSAVNAVTVASEPQQRLMINDAGRLQLQEAPGNPSAHVVLRGGEAGTNYHAAAVDSTANLLAQSGFRDRRIMVDCSHGNSEKQHERQVISCGSVAAQVADGTKSIGGVLIESFLVAGRQNFEPGATTHLEYGKSITDACVDMNTTEAMLRNLAVAVRSRRGLSMESSHKVLAHLVHH